MTRSSIRDVGVSGNIPEIGSGTLDSRPRRRKDVRTRDTPAYSKCSRVVVIGQYPLSGKGAPMGRVEGKVAFITGAGARPGPVTRGAPGGGGR